MQVYRILVMVASFKDGGKENEEVFIYHCCGLCGVGIL